MSATNENVIEKSAEEEILEMFNYIERKIEEYIEYDSSYIDIQNIYNRIKEKYFQEIKAYNENQEIKCYNETGNEIGFFKFPELLLFARREAIKELTNLRIRVDGIEYESKKKKIIIKKYLSMIKKCFLKLLGKKLKSLANLSHQF